MVYIIIFIILISTFSKMGFTFTSSFFKTFIFKIIKPGQRLNIEFLQHILGIRIVAQFSLQKPKHVLMRLDERSFNGSFAPF